MFSEIDFIANSCNFSKNRQKRAHLINFESDEWHVATARSLEDEKKLLEAGFEYVRYSDRNEVAIYWKRK